ncbi:M10 family metallopeptidase C-terminal domain-containing protein [Tropicimonas sp. IMCC6043]|uniref:M10 family metallopeptidase C-terminal domain-containing protein n=1 Tax=Tropicimonas sp. IMCC6043 TaxID=2510645 RepID=UPI00101B7E8A|nr:M10 family metallopeptidase C-terminal domain-containing protein [Tropicimonas sp. IMCC6043]RYH06793.1 hypothetical protein EU800_22510 [Tropicimonas sp. IMCC6043]
MVTASESVLFDLSGVTMDVEHVEVSLSLSDSTVDVFLRSAAGTLVELYGSGDAPAGELSWSFGAESFLGEAADGIWSLEFVNDGGGPITVGSYTIDWFGSGDTADDVYHYTDEMFKPILDGAGDTLSAPAEDSARLALADGDGGEDWFNLAAMTGELEVNLNLGASSTSDGRVFATITEGTIENATGGDRSDRLIGNEVGNELHGMRGDDVLDGGLGEDVLAGGSGSDTFIFELGSGHDVILDFTNDGVSQDRVALVGFNASFAELSFATAVGEAGGMDTVLSFASRDSLTFAGVDLPSLTEADFLFLETSIV